MKKSEIESSLLNEKIYRCDYDNGLKAFVLPKKGYTKKFAIYSTHYGSIDSEFIIPGEQIATKVPDGIAHFLEHKLFEQEDGSAMDKFSALGSMSNAYTSFDHTAYLFSCSDNFSDSFSLLMKFVQNPYITAESVEKEKGIIGQEIRMYDDNPNWRVFFNYLTALYHSHPVRIDIAGTVESISHIDKDTLYKCFNTFYHPSNMIVFVAGDVDQKWVFDSISKSQKIMERKPEIKRIFPEEPDSISKKIVEQKMEVSEPLFIFGFKENTKDTFKNKAEHTAAMNILMEMIFGRGSDLYSELYEKGLINSNFDGDYTFESNYAYSSIGGESKSPEEVLQLSLDKISDIRKKGLNQDDFNRIKKMKFGNAVKIFNSVDKIAHQFVSNYMKGIDMFEFTEILGKIEFNKAYDAFEKHFNAENVSMSIIRPL